MTKGISVGNSGSSATRAMFQVMALVLPALLALAVVPASLWAQDTIVYNFQGPFAVPADGSNPNGGLVADSAGNLYGTTAAGGNLGTGCPDPGCGVLYKLTPTLGGFPYTETVLYYFTGCGISSCSTPGDGASPQDTLLIDKFANLYGTTSQGGYGCNANTGCGAVFVYCQSTSGPYCGSVTPPAELVLAVMSPSSSNGRHPYGQLAMDTYGNLYGTNIGGVYNPNCGSGIAYPGCGSVFVVCAPGVTNPTDPSPCATGLASPTYNEIYQFGGVPDGANPFGGLVISAKGILYGTTASGGKVNASAEPCARYIEGSVQPGCGVVFRLAPSGGPIWTETVLYSFLGYPKDGSYPMDTLVVDSKGDLYGTTDLGPLGGGTVFELKGTAYAEKILFKFTNRWDGGTAYAGVTFDNSYKTLYGATYSGGGGNNGAVFELDLIGATWKEPAATLPVANSALWSFTPSSGVHGQCAPSSAYSGDGCNPYGGVIPVEVSNSAGTATKYLFGTTYDGGNGGNSTAFNQGYGTVYAVLP